MATLNQNFAHGASGAVGIQGYSQTATVAPAMVTLVVKKWEVTETRKVDDTSNTGTTGYTVAQGGKWTAKVAIDAQLVLNAAATGFDNTHNPIASTGPNLQADYCTAVLVGGTTPAAAAVTNATSTIGNQLYSFPCLVMDNFKITNANDEVIDYTISATSSGPYTRNNNS